MATAAGTGKRDLLRSLVSRARGGMAGIALLGVLIAPAGAAASPASQTNADWPMYHANPARTGDVAGFPDPRRLALQWTQRLDGAVYAEPLVVGGQVLVATENDSLYALDARTGRVRWRTNIGSPVPQSSLPCGDIFPLGITGTPVYDAKTGLVFAVAETPGPTHVLVGVQATTGRLKVRRVVDPAGMAPLAHQQRAALALANGRAYVAFGGLDGDCGAYHGLLVGARTDGTGPLLTYQVPTTREGGIWATSGPAVDARGNLYVAVGNGAASQGAWDKSDSVLRLSPTLRLLDGFAPASWQSDNANDADLGSMGPVLLPNGLIYTNGKSGAGYLLRASHLGGIGGQLQTISLCAAFGGAAVRGQALYIPCTSGLRELTLSGSRLTIGWQAPAAVTASPVVGGNTVYSLDPGNGVLYALNAGTGAVRASITVGPVQHFPSPTLWGQSVFVGTLGGIVAVTIKP